MKFYEKLFELRKKEGLSQEELAEKVNVSRQTVSKWESGQSSPEMDKLLILSHLFNISIDELVGKQKDEEKKKDNTPSKIKYKSLKIVIILLVIYLTIAIFKYISLTIMNNIGNSFNEESYNIMINNNANTGGKQITNYYNIIKIRNKVLEKYYYMDNYEKPYQIVYIDLDKNERYEITYSEEEGKYILTEDTKSIGNEVEIEELFNKYRNLNDFKSYAVVDKYSIVDKIKMSLNPFLLVNPFAKKIVITMPFNGKAVYEYNNDFLLSRVFIKYKDSEDSFEENISYDYVPDHFKNIEIENPMESGEYEIKEINN